MCTFVFGHFVQEIQLDLAVKQMKSVIFLLQELNLVQPNKYKNTHKIATGACDFSARRLRFCGVWQAPLSG